MGGKKPLARITLSLFGFLLESVSVSGSLVGFSVGVLFQQQLNAVEHRCYFCWLFAPFLAFSPERMLSTADFLAD